MSPERKQKIKDIADPVRQIGQILGVAACVYFSGSGKSISDTNLETLARIEAKLDANIKITDRQEIRMDKHDQRMDRMEDGEKSSHKSLWTAINGLRPNHSNNNNSNQNQD